MARTYCFVKPGSMIIKLAWRVLLTEVSKRPSQCSLWLLHLSKNFIIFSAWTSTVWKSFHIILIIIIVYAMPRI
jgi:hypothetical protein